MTRSKTYRDTYQAHPWLSGQDASFLDSLFPQDQLDHQVTQAIRELQKLKRKDSSGHITTIHDLESQLDEANSKVQQLAIENQQLADLHRTSKTERQVSLELIDQLQGTIKGLKSQLEQTQGELEHARSQPQQFKTGTASGTYSTDNNNDFQNFETKKLGGVNTLEFEIGDDTVPSTIKGSDVIHNAKPEGNPIAVLQELCQQSVVMSLPTYTFQPTEGGNYRSICQVGDITAEASGRSKKIAKGWAASLAVKLISRPVDKAIERPSVSQPKLKSAPKGLPIVANDDLAVQRIHDLCDSRLRALLGECCIQFISHNLLNIQTSSFGILERLEKRQGAISSRAEKVCGWPVTIRLECRPIRQSS